MPRNLPHYTQCAVPGSAYSMLDDGLVGGIVGSLLLGGMGGTAYHVVMQLLGYVGGLGCAIGVGVGIAITAALLLFKDWYYNYRLMCIRKNVCACGTVVGDPHTATDGDRKIDLLVAPFESRQTEAWLVELLDSMRASLPNLPWLADLANRQILFGFIRGLDGATLKEVYIRLTEEKMFNQPGKEFQKFLYRRMRNIMGDAAFDNSPDDTLAAGDPNPMFRYTHKEGDDPEEKVLVPWLHCEVEGNRLERWLENVLAGWITGLVAYTALCVACEVVTGGVLDFLCGWVGGLLSLLIAFLAWLISHFVNHPDDGEARSVDVDVADADFGTPAGTAEPGDTVFLFGDWTMDMEHNNYFEIHPVKAYYLLCRTPDPAADWVLTEEVPADQCTLDVTQLVSADIERMCKIVQAAENTDPDDKITIPLTHAAAVMP